MRTLRILLVALLWIVILTGLVFGVMKLECSGIEMGCNFVSALGVVGIIVGYLVIMVGGVYLSYVILDEVI